MGGLIDCFNYALLLFYAAVADRIFVSYLFCSFSSSYYYLILIFAFENN